MVVFRTGLPVFLVFISKLYRWGDNMLSYFIICLLIVTIRHDY